MRLTTRYYEDFFPSALFSTMHEAGHGIYEQGLRAESVRSADRRSGVAGRPRVAIADVGESRRPQPGVLGAFLSAAPSRSFPGAFDDVPLEDFYFAINDVRPSLIRVEADEATYNLHIMVRFELEQALLLDELRVADLPAAWHEKYRKYLGIQSPTDADGVLQDVHWGAGLVGYFPTYSLGNLYAAQLFEKAEQDLGDFAAMFRRGEFLPLRDWLRVNVHEPGRRYAPAELVRRVTGDGISHGPLMRHLLRQVWAAVRIA